MNKDMITLKYTEVHVFLLPDRVFLDIKIIIIKYVHSIQLIRALN